MKLSEWACGRVVGRKDERGEVDDGVMAGEADSSDALRGASRLAVWMEGRSWLSWRRERAAGRPEEAEEAATIEKVEAVEEEA